MAVGRGGGRRGGGSFKTEGERLRRPRYISLVERSEVVEEAGNALAVRKV